MLIITHQDIEYRLAGDYVLRVLRSPCCGRLVLEMFEAMYNVLVSGICGVVIVIFRCKIASEWYDILRCCGTESRPTS